MTLDLKWLCVIYYWTTFNTEDEKLQWLYIKLKNVYVEPSLYMIVKRKCSPPCKIHIPLNEVDKTWQQCKRKFFFRQTQPNSLQYVRILNFRKHWWTNLDDWNMSPLQQSVNTWLICPKLKIADTSQVTSWSILKRANREIGFRIKTSLYKAGIFSFTEIKY